MAVPKCFNILNYSPNSIIVLDEILNIVYINLALRKLLGHPEDYLGKSILEKFPHLNKGIYTYQLKNVVENGACAIFSSQLHKCFIQIKLLDQSYQIQHTTVTAMPIEDGRGFYAVITIEDYTDVTKRIKDYRLMRDKALAEIEERKKIEAKLLNSEQKLKDLNDSKDKFFSIIAHDLKNPFMGLLGILEMMIEDFNELSDEEKIGLLKELLDSSKSVFGLLVGLLDWARIQTGAMEYYPDFLKMQRVIDSVFKVLNINANSKGIKLINSVDGNVFIMADNVMISTIIRNLVSNAIKFTSTGGWIIIEAVQKEDFSEIIVKDSGIGIPQEVIPKLFKIDSNSSTRGTNNEGGTGLGLILCRELALKHGGDIEVTSEVGRGSVFKIILPNKDNSNNFI